MENNQEDPKTPKEQIITELFKILGKKMGKSELKEVDVNTNMSIGEDGLKEDMAINLKFEDSEEKDVKVHVHDMGVARDIDDIRKIMMDIKAKEEEYQMKEYEEFVNKHFERMNLDPDFSTLPYISDTMGIILSFLENVNRDDFMFLCKKMGEALEKYDGTSNAYRVSIMDDNDHVSSDYNDVIKGSCCNAYDEDVQNPVTGNKFKIGFNHTHVAPSLKDILKNLGG
jgi:hypothetical protein